MRIIIESMERSYTGQHETKSAQSAPGDSTYEPPGFGLVSFQGAVLVEADPDSPDGFGSVVIENGAAADEAEDVKGSNGFGLASLE